MPDITKPLAELEEWMRMALKRPIKYWETGEVVETSKVDDWADELHAIRAQLDEALDAHDAEVRNLALEEAAKLVELVTARSEGRDTTAKAIRALKTGGWK